MMTKEQIIAASFEWRNSAYEPTAIHGFQAGAEWAIEQMRAELDRVTRERDLVDRLMVESGNGARRLKEENAALRAQVFDQQVKLGLKNY